MGWEERIELKPDVLAGKLGLGFARGVETTEFDPALLLALNITQEHIDEVAQTLPEALEETQALFRSV